MGGSPALKIGIFSHCAIDTIRIEQEEHERVGGAACYCGLTARAFGADVHLATRFGSDFPADEYLRDHVHADDALSESPTTRFLIEINGPSRELYLENACDPIPYRRLDVDGIIISPIFDELSSRILEKSEGFTLLDPQGFLRRTDESGRIRLERTDLSLDGVTAIKAGAREMACLADGSAAEQMKTLQDRGVEYVLRTDGPDIDILVKERVYSLRLPNKKIHDTTGVGDIFCSTFLCTMLREKDFLWAFCFAAGSAQAALDSRDVGLDKIPSRGSIEINASYFYNTVKFRRI